MCRNTLPPDVRLYSPARRVPQLVNMADAFLVQDLSAEYDGAQQSARPGRVEASFSLGLHGAIAARRN